MNQTNFSIAEINISYNHRNSFNNPKVKSSNDSYLILKEFMDEGTLALQEQFYTVYLNHGHKVIGVCCISKGGINFTTVDVRLVLGIGLKAGCSSIILAHNHPSGNLTPSEEDKRITTKIKAAALLMDIKVIDHIIITPDDSYFSFSDEGLL